MAKEAVFVFSRNAGREFSLKKARAYLYESLNKLGVDSEKIILFVLIITEIAKNIYDHSDGGEVHFLIQQKNIEFFTVNKDFSSIIIPAIDRNFGLGLRLIEDASHSLKMEIKKDGWNYRGVFNF